MALSAADIERAFDALSEELSRRGERAQMVIAGGAASVLLFGARETTKDVDAYFLQPDAAVIREAAAAVALRLGLPNDWLNDGAKGYFVGITNGAPLYESPSLSVRSATLIQLLAMKLAAWRDAVDRSDASLLLREIQGSKSEIWSQVKRFVPPPQLDKASYAFDDLWETENGA